MRRGALAADPREPAADLDPPASDGIGSAEWAPDQDARDHLTTRAWSAPRPARCGCARALLSVSDKHGIVEFARGLEELGVEIVSTGGTARELAGAGIAVRSIEDFTGFPEIMDGRVKTLHPRLYGGPAGPPRRRAHLRRGE